MIADLLTSVAFDAIVLAAFLGLLIRSATFAVDNIVKFANAIRLSELAAGFLIVAIATSAPEISVAVFSVTSGNVGITLGDIFGSNVTNISLIAPLLLLLSPVRLIQKSTLRRMGLLLIVSSVIPVILLLAGNGSRFVGFALLAVFGMYLYLSVRATIARKTDLPGTSPDGNGPLALRKSLKHIAYFAAGITLVIISAHFIVSSASSIADATGIRESVLGATVIALGTSLPELSVDLAAVRKRHLDLALGDIIGSSLTNIALVLGIVLVTTQAAISFSVMTALISFAVVSHVILFAFLRMGKIRHWQSVILFAIYLTFIVTIYAIQPRP